LSGIIDRETSFSLVNMKNDIDRKLKSGGQLGVFVPVKYVLNTVIHGALPTINNENNSGKFIDKRVLAAILIPSIIAALLFISLVILLICYCRKRKLSKI
jgi:hypothetical protein